MASITVVGTGFTGATMCFFGTIGVTIDLNASGTSFTCIPPAQTGTVNIGITGYGRTVTKSSGYTYMGTPTITSLGITLGNISGWQPIRIIGNNYYDRSVNTFPGTICGISFGNTYGQVGFIQGTTGIYTYSPPGETYGIVLVTVNTPTGSSRGFTFTYLNPCSCTVLPDDPDYSIYGLAGCSGATFPCTTNHSPAVGCNCCGCCQAVSTFDPQCSQVAWDQHCVDIITSRLTDTTDSIYKACNHLFYGACCVKFSISAGITYTICLGSQGNSYECDLTANDLNANNNGFPWGITHTTSFILGATCGACNASCGLTQCGSSGGSVGGFTCSNCQNTPCCFFFGYCGTGCHCTGPTCITTGLGLGS